MGTSQSHNLKSTPNWTATKRAMTSIVNGTGNNSATNAKFIGNFGTALGNEVVETVRLVVQEDELLQD